MIKSFRHIFEPFPTDLRHFPNILAVSQTLKQIYCRSPHSSTGKPSTCYYLFLHTLPPSWSVSWNSDTWLLHNISPVRYRSALKPHNTLAPVPAHTATFLICVPETVIQLLYSIISPRSGTGRPSPLTTRWHLFLHTLPPSWSVNLKQ